MEEVSLVFTEQKDDSQGGEIKMKTETDVERQLIKEVITVERSE